MARGSSKQASGNSLLFGARSSQKNSGLGKQLSDIERAIDQGNYDLFIHFVQTASKAERLMLEQKISEVILEKFSEITGTKSVDADFRKDLFAKIKQYLDAPTAQKLENIDWFELWPLSNKSSAYAEALVNQQVLDDSQILAIAIKTYAHQEEFCNGAAYEAEPGFYELRETLAFAIQELEQGSDSVLADSNWNQIGPDFFDQEKAVTFFDNSRFSNLVYTKGFNFKADNMPSGKYLLAYSQDEIIEKFKMGLCANRALEYRQNLLERLYLKSSEEIVKSLLPKYQSKFKKPLFSDKGFSNGKPTLSPVLKDVLGDVLAAVDSGKDVDVVFAESLLHHWNSYKSI